MKEENYSLKKENKKMKDSIQAYIENEKLLNSLLESYIETSHYVMFIKDVIFSNPYRAFYGEWEVREYLGSLPESKSDQEKYMGQKLIIMHNKIECGNIYYEWPYYEYYLLHNRPNDSLINNGMTNKELGISGTYYIYFYFMFDAYGRDLEDNTLHGFYMADENTLIMVTKDGGYYKVKRTVSYEDIYNIFPCTSDLEPKN